MGRRGRLPPSTSGLTSVFHADEDELFPPARTRVAVAPAGRSRAPARAAVASCLCQSRCRGSRDGAPSAGAEPVWRRCEVQLLLLRDGGAGDEIVLPVAAGAGAPPAGAEPACQLPAEPASRERRRFGSSYARTGMEWVWPLCVECQATGRGTVTAATRTIERRSEQISLSVRFF